MFLGEPRNITELMFLRVPDEQKNFYFFFAYFIPGASKTCIQHTKTAEWLLNHHSTPKGDIFMLAFHLYLN
jgi:hypothetical protein